jgi:hypothetical protein
MANIKTLIPDVQQLLTTKGWMTDTLAQEFGRLLGLRLQEQFSGEHKRTLRMSRLGPQCPCALWYSVHNPGLAEPFQPWTENKFSFGHMIEVWAITLAKAAGHSVTGEQDAVFLDGVEGHRDCIVDGCLVDVKSTSSRGFLKFKDGTLGQNDDFGYLDQLDAYTVASLDDPLLEVKDKAYLWPIQKELGHMCLYEHKVRETHIRSRVSSYKDIVERGEAPPCTCGDLPEGKSGNRVLDVKASYNSYKFCCNPNIRVFIYANGPKYFTNIVKRPTRQDGSLIPEVDKEGKFVYN